MASITLYGSPMSTCTKRVLTVCNELGIKCTLSPVDLGKFEHKAPDFLATKNPFGAVPILVDEDGTQLFESRAICRYLTAKYGKGSGLVPDPSDFKMYGLFEQAASIEYSSFDPAASGLTWERRFAGMFGLPSSEEVATKHVSTLKSKMEGYERILSKQKYLAGEHVTLADLFHLPYGAWVNEIDPTIIAAQPHVKKWWDDISSRESWKQANEN